MDQIYRGDLHYTGRVKAGRQVIADSAVGTTTQVRRLHLMNLEIVPLDYLREHALERN